MADTQEISTGSNVAPTARQTGDCLAVAICSEIDLNNSPKLRGVLLDLIEKHQPKRLILNLEKVPYMDSSAIAVLVESLQKMRKISGRIFLTNLQPRVKGLIEIARLDTIFTLVPDEQTAIEAK